MIEPKASISIKQQCEMLNISRGYYYYQPVELSEEDLRTMEKIDELYTEDPTRGTRRLSRALRKRIHIKVGRAKVKRLMRIMGICAVYPKKNLSISNQAHKKYPYLLRNMEITHPNQVWSTDITYIRLKRGFVYLTAIVDWYSRYVLSWRISTTLDRRFCVDALNEAMIKYGKPEIFNTDQGCQYTSEEFTGILKAADIKISMNGKGRAVDNSIVERLWRTVKYDEVYLNCYQNVQECKERIGSFFNRYNNLREHQALDYNYPAEIYFKEIELEKKAA